MKHILTYLLILTACTFAQTQRNPVSTNNNGDVNRNLKVPSGRSFTVAAGSTFNVESGANITGLAAAFKGAGFVTIDGSRTDGALTAGTQISPETRFITFKSTSESVSGDMRLMRLPDAAALPNGTVVFYADLFNNDGPVSVGIPYMFLGVHASDSINGGTVGTGMTLGRRGHWWSFRSDGANNWVVDDLGALGSGGTGSGGGGTFIFADDASRATTASPVVGQLGLQLNDGSLWRADSNTAGSWKSQFSMRNLAGADAPILTLASDYNGSTSVPLFHIFHTDTGFAGPMLQISDDGTNPRFTVSNFGNVYCTSLGFVSDVGLNTWIGFNEDVLSFVVGGSDNLRVDSSGVRIGASGNAINAFYTGTATLNFPSIAAGAESTLTITVTGVASATTPSVQLGWSAALEDGIVVKQAWVSGANTVSVRVRNVSGGAIDPAAVVCRAGVSTF